MLPQLTVDVRCTLFPSLPAPEETSAGDGGLCLSAVPSTQQKEEGVPMDVVPEAELPGAELETRPKL